MKIPTNRHNQWLCRLIRGSISKMWRLHYKPPSTFHPKLDFLNSRLTNGDIPSPQRRAAYVLATPPSRHRRQPSRTVEFCRVNGCERWTDDRGKKLARHRACHFPGKVGVMCPGCDKIFSRSSVCGKHLKKCNRKIWDDRAAAKGTQDSWGQRVGQDLIDQSLVDRIYNPKTKYKL